MEFSENLNFNKKKKPRNCHNYNQMHVTTAQFPHIPTPRIQMQLLTEISCNLLKITHLTNEMFCKMHSLIYHICQLQNKIKIKSNKMKFAEHNKN